MSYILLSHRALKPDEPPRPLWLRRDAIMQLEPLSDRGAGLYLSTGLHVSVEESPEEVLSILGWETPVLGEPDAVPTVDIVRVLEALVVQVETINQRVQEITALVQPVAPALRFYTDDPRQPGA